MNGAGFRSRAVFLFGTDPDAAWGFVLDFSDSGGRMKIRRDRKGDFLKPLAVLAAVS